MLYQIELRHPQLNKYRMIRGTDPYVVQQKANAQQAAWNEMWAKKEAALQKYYTKEEMKLIANQRTSEAQKALQDLEMLLKSSLSIPPEVVWETLKDKQLYRIPIPSKAPSHRKPNEPSDKDEKYSPKLGILDRLSSTRKQRKIEASAKLFRHDHDIWLRQCKQTEDKNRAAVEHYEKAVSLWENDKESFLDEQKQKNSIIDEQKRDYLAKQPEAIIDYCELVLSGSEYPEDFPQEYDIDYIPETQILLVDYLLPSLEHIPSLKEAKYIASKNELKDVNISESAHQSLFDIVLYQIAIRVLRELFDADSAKAIDAIALNGWVRTIDKGTGQEIKVCVLSVYVTLSEFKEINLSQVDPKVCFKKLKGIAASKLHNLAAIEPIMKMDKKDRRFIDARSVVGEIDSSINLASMDWEDFEHLIREIFEKEFSQNGGEVKITQASRDRGVDAIAFDPDPIRGGKIVIQAKRYAHTVDVSAVRDLYGTVLNEGATKGILVTTADYGGDSYEFAKSKPITLLNGNNLLFLLQKHGHRARIDLQEARRTIAEQKRAEG
jgi:restriction system protein